MNRTIRRAPLSLAPSLALVLAASAAQEITNDNLRKGPSPTPTPKGTTGKSLPGKGSGKEASTAVPSPSAPYVARDDKGRSEDDWRKLVDRSKAAVQIGESHVRELETKAKQLENDFYAQSDGYRRDGVIKPAWDKTRGRPREGARRPRRRPQGVGRPHRGRPALERAARLAPLAAC